MRDPSIASGVSCAKERSIVFPASAVIPTRDRAISMTRFLESLTGQSHQPAELIIVDASPGTDTETLLALWDRRLVSAIRYHRASTAGAAAQRNQGVALAREPFILFMDDDILLESDCLSRLWSAMGSDPTLGGVNAMITNQCYSPPGRVTRTLFRTLHGSNLPSFAGKCIGPALNLLPEDADDLPAVVDTEWLNTTCTLYRREALPEPPFSGHFTGYSMMEDLTLSLIVSRSWRLANARTARIYHASEQSGDKLDVAKMARMELVNRHYVMRQILDRRSSGDYGKLLLLEMFGIVSALCSTTGLIQLPKVLAGKASGLAAILRDWRRPTTGG